jgi:hypothetical protein
MRFLKLLLSILLTSIFFILIVGCGQNDNKKVVPYIELSKVKSVYISKYMTGITLDSKKDSEKIKTIIDYINSCKNRHKAAPKELQIGEVPETHGGNSPYNVIYMNDGSCYYALFDPIVTYEKDGAISTTCFTDRLLLKDNNGYYVIYSKTFYKYLTKWSDINILK